MVTLKTRSSLILASLDVFRNKKMLIFMLDYWFDCGRVLQIN